jgi:plasmid stabilization system protein ParE
MENTYKLVWSDEAIKNLKGIIGYLENNWTQKEIRKFVKLLDKQLALIINNPFLFAQSDHSKGIRKSVLSKQTTIYYRIAVDEIRIITLFDNRQNPDIIIKRENPYYVFSISRFLWVKTEILS